MINSKVSKQKANNKLTTKMSSIIGEKKIIQTIAAKSFRLFSFDILNMTRADLDGAASGSGSDEDAPKKKNTDNKIFVVQMYQNLV